MRRGTIFSVILFALILFPLTSAFTLGEWFDGLFGNEDSQSAYPFPPIIPLKTSTFIEVTFFANFSGVSPVFTLVNVSPLYGEYQSHVRQAFDNEGGFQLVARDSSGTQIGKYSFYTPVIISDTFDPENVEPPKLINETNMSVIIPYLSAAKSLMIVSEYGTILLWQGTMPLSVRSCKILGETGMLGVDSCCGPYEPVPSSHEEFTCTICTGPEGTPLKIGESILEEPYQCLYCDGDGGVFAKRLGSHCTLDLEAGMCDSQGVCVESSSLTEELSDSSSEESSGFFSDIVEWFRDLFTNEPEPQLSPGSFCGTNEDCDINSGERCVDDVCIDVNECEEGDVSCPLDDTESRCELTEQGYRILVDYQCQLNQHCNDGEGCVDNEPPEPPQCESDVECSEGEVCYEGNCVSRQCSSDGDCGDGRHCEGGMCAEDDPTPPGPSCDVNWDCDDGDSCTIDSCGSDGTCKNTPLECPDGNYCFEGQCLVLNCGNGQVDDGEECDDGNTNSGDGCSAICRNEVIPDCGDGTLNPDGGEECDDGNSINGDGCSSACEIECGNGQIDGGEECDDGNDYSGDGCSSTCEIECDNGQCDIDLCGNYQVDTGEECDDGDIFDGDGCSSTCQNECGDGKVDTTKSECCTVEEIADSCSEPDECYTEGCDDGGNEDGDGCSRICTCEPPHLKDILNTRFFLNPAFVKKMQDEREFTPTNELLNPFYDFIAEVTVKKCSLHPASDSLSLRTRIVMLQNGEKVGLPIPGKFEKFSENAESAIYRWNITGWKDGIVSDQALMEQLIKNIADGNVPELEFNETDPNQDGEVDDSKVDFRAIEQIQNCVQMWWNGKDKTADLRLKSSELFPPAIIISPQTFVSAYDSFYFNSMTSFDPFKTYKHKFTGYLDLLAQPSISYQVNEPLKFSCKNADYIVGWNFRNRNDLTQAEIPFGTTNRILLYPNAYLSETVQDTYVHELGHIMGPLEDEKLVLDDHPSPPSYFTNCRAVASSLPLPPYGSFYVGCNPFVKYRSTMHSSYTYTEDKFNVLQCSYVLSKLLDKSYEKYYETCLYLDILSEVNSCSSENERSCAFPSPEDQSKLFIGCHVCDSYDPSHPSRKKCSIDVSKEGDYCFQVFVIDTTDRKIGICNTGECINLRPGCFEDEHCKAGFRCDIEKSSPKIYTCIPI